MNPVMMNLPKSPTIPTNNMNYQYQPISMICVFSLSIVSRAPGMSVMEPQDGIPTQTLPLYNLDSPVIL